GGDHTPALQWSDVPEGTKSFVMIMEDPDAPIITWTHWVLYNIPATSNEVSDQTSVGTAGMNSWFRADYGGPCPPKGTHRYFFRLYALDTLLDLPPKASKKQILRQMHHHILQKATLVGLYP